MSRSTQKIFKQLDDQRKARPVIEQPISISFYHPRHSSYPPQTLGCMADQLAISPDVLVDQFSQAGILGLTPEHRIRDSHKDRLLIWCRKKNRRSRLIYVDTSPVAEKLIIVQDLNKELLAELSKYPEMLHHLEPRRFEEVVARMLEDQGCEVALTKRTRDGGYDIFGRIKGSISNIVFIAECKRYSKENRVGVEVIRGLYGAMEMQRANLGLIITTSSFTRDAQEEKLRIGPRIELKEFDDLCAWLSIYAKTG